MSDNLYTTRLRFSGSSGMAMLHGKRVPLTDNPVICGHRVFQIDYAPEVQVFQIRRAPSARTDEMTPAEIADADALLRRLTATSPQPPERQQP